MVRKYKKLAAALCAMALILALCLALPGVFLGVDSRRDVGQVNQAGQQYYADNISAKDTFDFDLVTRLLMLSGAWKSSGIEITPADVAEGDDIFGESQMMHFGRDVFFALFNGAIQSYNWDDVFWNELLLGMDEAAKDYVRSAIGYEIGGDSSVAQNLEDGGEMADLENAGETTAYASVDYVFLELFYHMAENDSSCTLRRYDDKVLNSYYFYVWEFQVKNETLGVDFTILMDAVTLELYRLECHGSLAEAIPWDVTMSRWKEASYNEWLLDNTNRPMTGSSLEVPLTLWMAYWDCLTGNGYIEPVYGEDMTGTVQSIYTSENLYRFPGGNIFFAGNVYYSFNSSQSTITVETGEGNQVYIRGDYSKGIEWYLSAEEA